jgi:diguanylate cyclase (GGDEF)-like protein
MSGAFLPSLSARWTALFRNMTPAAGRDLAIVLFVGAVAYAAAIAFDAFDHVISFVVRHEDYEIDEIFAAVLIASVAVFFFAGRRMAESMLELKRRVAAEDEAKALAMHDPLTGLPNRRRLEAELRLVLEVGDPVAVVIADLDRFKPVNDLYGHPAGDAVLVRVAERLVADVEPQDFVSRIGGDEFVLVLRDIADSERVLRRLTLLATSFAAPIDVGAAVVSVGATMGVVVTADGVDTPSELLRRADIALYRAKEDGRGRFAFFETAMDVKVQKRLLLERQLRTSIANDEIEPFFQPLVVLETGEVYGYEVLARMRRLDGSLVMPDHFIHLAEELGLIEEMTVNLLRRSCIEARDWPGAPLLSVNLSPVQLRDPDLPQKILKILIETGFPASRLQVEITESALVNDFDLARASLISFRNQGIRVALDDFGTGYSSLRHLRELPFDNLKIDRSFIMSMNESEESRTIVRTIVDLAKNLGLALTAEGIETPDNAVSLMAIGCTTGQGYLFGRPVAAEAIRERYAALEAPAAAETRKGAA